MLPEYQALSFLKIIDKGGRTRPWVVMVDTEIGIKPYVVKLFTEAQIETRNSVVNEVIGAVLAGEFDFQIPKPALIIFSDSFISTLSNEHRRILDSNDQRIKFGCELLDGINLFQPDLPQRAINGKIDIDTLFAFDNLIRNRDRNSFKPNLLLKEQNVWLIDHELGFENINTAIASFKYGTIVADSGHLFYKYLNKANPKTKQKYFGTFVEYLKNLQLNKLSSYYQQLNRHGFLSNEAEIKEWLELVKQNSTKFVNLLKGTIR